MSTPTERRYRREARYSKQLRVTVQPAMAAALEAEADAAGVSVSAVIRDAVARGLPLVKDARRKQRQRDRRVGREYHGPCPVSGAGRDCCFASEGRAGDVALGCRKCGGNGGKLDSESFLAHLAALVGETARHVAAHATNDRAAIATPSALPRRAWRASEPVDGTPGPTYLVARRVWPAGERFPASVRWLPATLPGGGIHLTALFSPDSATAHVRTAA